MSPLERLCTLNESTLFHSPEENMIHQDCESPDLSYETSTSQITVPVE
jgi:hypothetical protein